MKFDLIEIFLNTLEKSNIHYVHWKSNTNIDKALSGEDDLDILVDPKKKHEVYTIFQNLNITRGYSTKDSWQNEIFHYFGMDIYNKKLVHIHLHFLLEVGYDFDKSVNLPIIEKYINSRIKYKYVYIPSVENEYVLLIIRLLLKNAFIPFIMMLPAAQYKMYRKQKKGIVTGSAYSEYIDLNNRLDRDKLSKTLDDNYSFIDKSFFYECEKVIKENNSLGAYFNYSKKLKKILIPYSYHSEFKSFLLSFTRINKTRLDKLLNNRINSKKLPEYGGRIFAFVGGDGAGKSSNIEKLQNILKKHFYVKTIHIGRPKLHLIGNLLLVISKIFKIFGLKDLRQAMIYLAVAYGRKKEFQDALKIKKNGGIVILDRIPLDGITSMDCPRIHTIKNNKFDWLSKIEKNMHKMIEGVDELIVLKLNPHIALERRPEDDPDELLIRSGQIWNKDFSDIKNSHIINTENTFDFVEEKVLEIIWSSLYNKVYNV
jgi:thymidylate kinase